MSLQDDITDDLQRKLQEDMRRAMMHFAEMCQIADIPNRTAWAGMLSTLARGVIQLAQHGHMPKDAFFDALGEQWDYCVGPKRRRPARTKEVS